MGASMVICVGCFAWRSRTSNGSRSFPRSFTDSLCSPTMFCMDHDGWYIAQKSSCRSPSRSGTRFAWYRPVHAPSSPSFSRDSSSGGCSRAGRLELPCQWYFSYGQCFEITAGLSRSVRLHLCRSGSSSMTDDAPSSRRHHHQLA